MTLNKILRWTSISCLFIALVIPLIVMTNLYFPYIVGKNVVFRVFTELAFGAWVVLAFRDSRYRPNFNYLTIAFAAFLVLITISDLHGLYPYKSIWSNFERMEGLVTHVHLFLYFITATVMLASEEAWRWFFNTSLAVSVIVSINGISQLFGANGYLYNGNRLDATLGNADYLAVYMLFNIFFAIFLFFRSAGKKAWQWVYGIVVVLELFVLYFTATRGVVLGFAAGLLLAMLIIAIFEKQRKVLKRVAVSIIVIVVVVAGAFFLMRNVPAIRNNAVLGRFAGISLTDPTTQSRFLIWHMAFEGFKARPFFGYGQENFNYVFNQYYNPQLYGQEQWFDRAHNVIFDWLIAGGILGLLSYLSLFVFAFYYLWKKAANPWNLVEKSILSGLLVGYLFQNLFVFDNVVSYLLFFSVLAYIVSARRRSEGAISKDSSTSPLWGVMTVVMVIVVIVGIYETAWKPYEASATLIDALSSQSSLSVNLADFNKALGYNTTGRPEIREQMLQAADEVISASTVSDTDKNNFAQAANDQMLDQIAETPLDARYFYFYGTFLSGIGETTQAITELERAHTLSPEKQTISLALVSAYINNKQYDQAFALAKSTYLSETADQTSEDVYGSTAVYDNQPAVLMSLYGSLTPAVDEVGKAYLYTNNFAKAIIVAKAEVVATPTSADPHLLLAAVYIQEKDTPDAVAEIKIAISLNPDFAAQGQAVIDQLEGTSSN